MRSVASVKEVLLGLCFVLLLSLLTVVAMGPLVLEMVDARSFHALDEWLSGWLWPSHAISITLAFALFAFLWGYTGGTFGRFLVIFLFQALTTGSMEIDRVYESKVARISQDISASVEAREAAEAAALSDKRTLIANRPGSLLTAQRAEEQYRAELARIAAQYPVVERGEIWLSPWDINRVLAAIFKKGFVAFILDALGIGLGAMFARRRRWQKEQAIQLIQLTTVAEQQIEVLQTQSQKASKVLGAGEAVVEMDILASMPAKHKATINTVAGMPEFSDVPLAKIVQIWRDRDVGALPKMTERQNALVQALRA